MYVRLERVLNMIEPFIVRQLSRGYNRDFYLELLLLYMSIFIFEEDDISLFI